jgi:dihydrofolate reductase
MFSIIVAIAENLAIGKDNDLLWHIPGDLKRFKKITLAHTVIMGKRTYFSLPRRPLAERRNMVITDVPGEIISGCEMAYSIDDAISKSNPDEENFVMGGASVYRQFLPLSGKLYLTRVHKSFDGDVFFPEINPGEWRLLSREDFPYDQELGFAYSYENYERMES